MDIQTLLQQHANGFYDRVFDGVWDSPAVMNGYVVHSTDQEGSYVPRSAVAGACHATVNSVIDRATALAVITMPDRKLANNEGAILFYDWLLNKSFYSDAFLCKDPVLSLKHGFVKTIDISAAKWLGAAQLCRLGTSEFKHDMLAVYDILASGFDIHPLLLVLLTTELGFISDKKVVKAKHASKISKLKIGLVSSHSSHLPLQYIENVKTLKEVCKDDPNKPLWSPAHEDTFRQKRWPNGSNTVASKGMYNFYGQNEAAITELIDSLLKGTPSMLFNLAEEVMKTAYTPIWQDAIEELKCHLVLSKKIVDGVPINLSGLELFSKLNKLGE